MGRKGRKPAQVRYDKKYPPLTIRLDRSMRGVMDQLKKSEQTYQDIVFKILSGKLEPAKELAEELAQAKTTIAELGSIASVMLPNSRVISLREYIMMIGKEKLLL